MNQSKQFVKFYCVDKVSTQMDELRSPNKVGDNNNEISPLQINVFPPISLKCLEYIMLVDKQILFFDQTPLVVLCIFSKTETPVKIDLSIWESWRQ